MVEESARDAVRCHCVREAQAGRRAEEARDLGSIVAVVVIDL